MRIRAIHMSEAEYRGHHVIPAFGGWKIRYPSGAYSPEKYDTPDAARRSIDFDLNKGR